MTTEATERLLMVGVSYADAPLSVLERVVVSKDELPGMLSRLRAAGFAEAIVLSTCSRFEIYVVSPEGGEDNLLAVLERWAADAAGAVRKAMRVRPGPSVVRHLFRGSSGFQSSVIAEGEIH